jgi:hypothetical protein
VENKTSFTISNLPTGNYNRIEFIIGVDSLRNTSGAQTGDMDPAQLMYWDWNQGYIFLKLEGNYVSPDSPQGDIFQFHIGGFQGNENCIQTCRLNLPSVLSAKKKANPQLLITTNLDEFFVNPVKMGFDYYFTHISQGPSIFRDMSINYRDMFSVEKVSN